jgi:hypothetical protein
MNIVITLTHTACGPVCLALDALNAAAGGELVTDKKVLTPVAKEAFLGAGMVWAHCPTFSSLEWLVAIKFALRLKWSNAIETQMAEPSGLNKFMLVTIGSCTIS